MNKIDPIKLGIIWKRLNGMIDEVAESFIRSSFSAVVRENYDMAFSLLDVHGRQFIQTKKSIPSFIGTLPHTLQEILKKIPADQFSEGDVVISNDSWLGTGHLNDITMVAPIFKNKKLIAFAGSTAHTVDIGGAPSPNAQDSYEEGLCIPICKIVEKGIENQVVIDFLQQNLREPEETLGDIRAQFSAYDVATKKLLTLLNEEKLNDLDRIISNILKKSEQSMRKKIQDIPDGKYVDEMFVDGFDNPLKIKCLIEVKKDNITYADSPTKFEAGTMQTAEVVAFAKSIKFIQDLGIKNIEKHESEITKYGEEVLRKNNSVKLVGSPKNKGSVLSFTLDGIHAHDIATILDEDGVAIRAGHHCCQILHDKLGLSATARASLGVYNTKDDIDKLNESINKCKKIFNK